MVLDWLAVGLDPERCTIFQQSAVKEHAELYLLLGMLTPVPWLERNPTYKEQQRAARRTATSRPSASSAIRCCRRADVLVYKADGRAGRHRPGAAHRAHARDRAPLQRDSTATIFPEPQTLLTETPKIVGTDGRKMSKSYGNAVYLTERRRQRSTASSRA
mgnify:CR=1 FL=1